SHYTLQVSRACQDGTREFARRRPRLTERLSRIAEKACREYRARFGRSDDAVGSRRKLARRFAEGIGKLAGNANGDYREEDRRTYHKIARGCQIMRKLGLI
ncbi:hypothetical protein BHE74_00052396, partial [Ensete ventricosum]